MPANILNLPSYTVTALQENDHDYHIDAIAKDRPERCPIACLTIWLALAAASKW